jgi:hypothetical protein
MSGEYLVKPAVLWVSSQEMLQRRIVATMLASWICFPWIVRDFSRSSRIAVTAASSSAISNSVSKLPNGLSKRVERRRRYNGTGSRGRGEELAEYLAACPEQYPVALKFAQPGARRVIKRPPGKLE